MTDSLNNNLPAANLSPAMRQYQQFKAQYPGYVLFFRMGDFYEMFWEDAKLAAKVLGVALTSRSRGGLDADDAIPMAGVPFHAVEGYLRRMIAAGHKVAICEQTEDAALAKGLIKREVVRLMTPGTLTDDPLLDGRTDNFLAAVAFNVTKTDGYRAALAWVELSTGTCTAMSGSEAQVLDELARLRPAELIVPEQASGQPHPITHSVQALGINAITSRPGWQFTPHHAKEQLQRQWQTATAGGFGFADDDPAVLATAAILSYLEETQKTGLSHLRPLHRHVVEYHLNIDPASLAQPRNRPHRPLRHHRRLAPFRHRPHPHPHGLPHPPPMAPLAAARHRAHQRPAKRHRRLPRIPLIAQSPNRPLG